MTNPKIVREGFYFRAVAPGFRSHVVTSASQAGLLIRRRYGKEAELVAFEEYCGLTLPKE